MEFDYIFIEVFSIGIQSNIDAFFKSKTKDINLLSKVFQNDFTGYGWKYKTYVDLLTTIWDYNINHSDDKQIKVVAVDQPVFWDGIRTRKDYDVFLESHVARDYFLYLNILKGMKNFNEEKKGIFLSNTRHVYKKIRDKNGSLYWNCGTFFYNWHPDKTYSVRIHNVALSIEERRDNINTRSSQGLENFKYVWTKMEGGVWDEAFKLNNNNPIAFSLKDNVFGNSKYVGNHMLNVDSTQTIYDAYDAVIFLAPLDELHFTAKTNFFYTDEFRNELKRRIKVLHGDNLQSYLSRYNKTSIDDLLEDLVKESPLSKNELLK